MTTREAEDFFPPQWFEILWKDSTKHGHCGYGAWPAAQIRNFSQQVPQHVVCTRRSWPSKAPGQCQGTCHWSCCPRAVPMLPGIHGSSPMEWHHICPCMHVSMDVCSCRNNKLHWKKTNQVHTPASSQAMSDWFRNGFSTSVRDSSCSSPRGSISSRAVGLTWLCRVLKDRERCCLSRICFTKVGDIMWYFILSHKQPGLSFSTFLSAKSVT